MLEEEFGACQPSISSELALAPGRCQVIEAPECNEPHRVTGQLAEQLIEKSCGSHSLALIYAFLRKAGIDEREARAEFELFLSGTLSGKLLDMAAQWIEAERSSAQATDLPARLGRFQRPNLRLD